MEQKKILWITFIVGIFLLIVTGVALVLYSTADSRTPVIASVPVQNDVWVKPLPPAPPQQAPAVPENLNIDNIQAQTITVNTLDIRNITGAAPVVPENTAAVPKTETVKPENPVKAAPPKKTAAKKAPAAKPAPAAKTAAAKPKAATAYWIQAAAFTDKLKAEAARDELGKRLVTPNIFTKEQNGVTYYRVRVGPYTTQKEAEYWLEQFKSIKGFEQSFISQTSIQK